MAPFASPLNCPPPMPLSSYAQQPTFYSEIYATRADLQAQYYSADTVASHDGDGEEVEGQVESFEDFDMMHPSDILVLDSPTRIKLEENDRPPQTGVPALFHPYSYHRDHVPRWPAHFFNDVVPNEAHHSESSSDEYVMTSLDEFNCYQETRSPAAAAAAYPAHGLPDRHMYEEFASNGKALAAQQPNPNKFNSCNSFLF